jgi:hypothetical protein
MFRVLCNAARQCIAAIRFQQLEANESSPKGVFATFFAGIGNTIGFIAGTAVTLQQMKNGSECHG